MMYSIILSCFHIREYFVIANENIIMWLGISVCHIAISSFIHFRLMEIVFLHTYLVYLSCLLCKFRDLICAQHIHERMASRSANQKKKAIIAPELIWCMFLFIS